MAQTNYTPISLYYSTTASAVPTAANLVPGELAINTADGKLYYEDSSGVVQVLATKSTGSIGGSNTQVQFNNSGSLGGSSGLTWDGSFLTTSSIKNSALTSGRVTYAGASGLLSDSASLTFNGSVLSTPTLYPTASSGVGIQMTSTGNNNGYWTIANNFGQMIVGTEGSAGSLVTGSAQGSALIGNAASNPLQFFTNNTVRATITNTTLYTASGVSVGIGLSNPSRVLELKNAQACMVFNDNTNLWTIGTGSFIDGSNSFITYLGGVGELMRINNSGNLGLGVTPYSGWAGGSGANSVKAFQISLYGTLDYNGGGYTNLGSNYYNASGTYKYGASDNASRFSQGGGQFQWFTAPSGTAGNAISFTQAMTLDASGNLLVGATSQIGATASRQVIKFDNNNFYGLALGGSASGAAGMLNFYNSAGTEQGYISVNGTGTTTYSTSSDYRLKENIVPMTGALAKVAQLKPVTYTWKEDGSNGQGFIAHELAEVVPDCVTREKDAVDENGNPVYQGVDTSFLVATLVSAIQEQQALIESLTTRLTALENK